MYRIYHVYEEFIAFVLRLGVVYLAYISSGQLLLAVCHRHSYHSVVFIYYVNKKHVNEHENMHGKHENKIVV